MNKKRCNAYRSGSYSIFGIEDIVSAQTLMKKEIPYFKPHGKPCFFDRNELDQWLRNIHIVHCTEKNQAE